MYITDFQHLPNDRKITFEVSNRGSKHLIEVEMDDNGWTSQDIDDFTEDWSDNDYKALEEFIRGCGEMVAGWNI